MWPRFLRGFSNALVVAYAVDAVLSALDLALDLSWLAVLRNGLALIVVFLSVSALPLLALSRRLAPTVFVPIVSSAIWFALGALPLIFYFDAAVIARGLVAMQLAIAAFAFVRVRGLQEGRAWLFDESWFSGSHFSFQYWLGSTVGSGVAVGIFGVLMVVSSFAGGIERATNGFVRFDREGISLADRVYTNFDRRIRLVGMMHIGEAEGYRSLFRDLGAASASTLVLTEGVSDTEGKLDRGLSYAPLADFLGVEEQAAIESYIEWHDDDPMHEGPVFMNADVDLREFDPRTIEWLDEVGDLYRGGEILARFRELYAKVESDPNLTATVYRDIIDLRNTRLIEHINHNREDYHEIVVPWGAIHLPAIEEAIQQMGFEHRRTASVPLVSWSRVFVAVFGDGQ